MTNRKYVAQRPLPSSCGLNFNEMDATAFFYRREESWVVSEGVVTGGEWYSKLDWPFL